MSVSLFPTVVVVSERDTCPGHAGQDVPGQRDRTPFLYRVSLSGVLLEKEKERDMNGLPPSLVAKSEQPDSEPDSVEVLSPAVGDNPPSQNRRKARPQRVSDDLLGAVKSPGASRGATKPVESGSRKGAEPVADPLVSDPPAVVPAPSGTVSARVPAHVPDVVPANRGGRPRKTVISNAQRALVSALASKGATPQMVAGQLGMGSSTFYRAMKEDPRVAEAFEIGRSQLGVDLVGELIRRALDPKAPQSTIALIYATKALFHFRDVGDPPAPEGSTRLKLELTMPKALPVARYAELVDRARRLGTGAAQAGGEAVIDAEVVQ